MTSRFNYARSAPGAYEAMDALDTYVQGSALERPLVLLVQLRASQINGCAYCIDMHWKDLRALGDTEQRLASLDAWRECPYYTPRERAALAWTEAMTLITQGHASDAVYDEARRGLSVEEVAQLTVVIAAINAWNRLSIASRLVPGGYQPAAVSPAAATPAGSAP